MAVEKGLKPAPDWSRGVPVGQSVEGSLGLAVEGAGERVHLPWPYGTEQGVRIRYLQLHERVTPLVDRDLDLSAGRLAAPRLFAAGEGRLHPLWTDRPTRGGERGLWHALLDS
jgi:hypothetical protein